MCCSELVPLLGKDDCGGRPGADVRGVTAVASVEGLGSTEALSPVGSRTGRDLESHTSFECAAAGPGQTGTLSLGRAGCPRAAQPAWWAWALA